MELVKDVGHIFKAFDRESCYQEMISLYGMLSGSAVVTKFISTHIFSVIIKLTFALSRKDCNKLDSMTCMTNHSTLQSQIHTTVEALLRGNLNTDSLTLDVYLRTEGLFSVVYYFCAIV
jgi:hypothetical protein